MASPTGPQSLTNEVTEASASRAAATSNGLREAEVLHVAKLARLELSPGELATMTAELSAIVRYVHKLAELDTSGVPPTTQVHVTRAPLRPDEPRPCLTHDAALAEAPRVARDGFAVPGFVEE